MAPEELTVHAVNLWVGTALLMVAIIRTTDKKGFTVFKMLSKGGCVFLSPED